MGHPVAEPQAYDAPAGNFSHPAASIEVDKVVPEDFQLIDEALAGRSAAFGELVMKYQDRVYNTLVHVTGSCEDARDVAQEAFVQAFVKLESFERASSFYTWLYRIALNLAISLRRRKSPSVSMDELRQQTGLEPVADDDHPAEPLYRNERARQVHAALAELTEEFRTVIVLREMENYSYEEIADMLEVPVGTVRSRLHRARMLLREQLEGILVEK